MTYHMHENFSSPPSPRISRKAAIIFLGGIAGAIAIGEGIHFVLNQQKPWQITSIDTMKDSRDKARDPIDLSYIEYIVQKVAHTNATHIAIGTPYDQEFDTRLQQWVQTARNYNLHVWFRGNFSSWEGWFGYPKNMSSSDHIQATRQFILTHADIFSDGDIFTPAPEPENVLDAYKEKDALITFLSQSYQTCQDAFSYVPASVLYGYYSVSADIALSLADTQVIKNIGNTVVVDHYVPTPQDMGNTIAQLHNTYPSAQVIIGEFGAPINGMNSDMSEHDQAIFIQTLIDQMERTKVNGVNYWVLFGGSTSLLHDDGSPKEAYYVIQKAYQRLGRRL